MNPQQIDRYQVKAFLGRGGMATVYHAFDPRFERDVAVKLMPREFLHDPAFLARFEREAKTIAALEHGAIVPVYDFGDHEGQPFLVMRYMAGGSLNRRIEEGPVGLHEAAQIIERIGSALDKAHSRGIVHRDVKPGNILFDEDRQAYLTDFGIVKLSEATAQLTGSGIIGTPAFMAPEMSMPGGLTPLIDIYALGVTLYMMLTGEQPYKADTPMGLYFAHMRQPIPDISMMRPDLPEAAQYLIDRALAKEPVDRYQMASEMAEDLQRVAAGASVNERGIEDTVSITRAAVPSPAAATPPPPPPTSPPPAVVSEPAPPAKPRRRKSRGWLWAILALAVFGAIIGGGIFIFNQVFDLLESAQINGSIVTDEPTEGPPTRTPTPTRTPSPTPVPPGGGSGYLVIGRSPVSRRNIYSISTDGTGRRTLTDSSANDYDAHYSPDGRQIVFVSNRGSGTNLYLMEADGSNVEQLTFGGSNLDPDWSPDGELIAFSSNRDGNQHIFVMDADGSNIFRVTSGDYMWLYDPVWMPGGYELIYQRYGQINLVYMDTGESEELLDFDYGTYDLAVSPGGDQIAFEGWADDDNDSEIYLFDLGSGSLRKLTDNLPYDNDPVWSPDGRRIAFNSYRDGNYEVYLMDTDGSNLARLTANEVDDYVSGWSPDGQTILLSADAEPNGGSDIYRVDIVGGGETALADFPSDEYQPAASPDGRWIAFTSMRDGYREIYLMNPGGGELTRLTDNEVSEYSLAWSPDGTKIVFAGGIRGEDQLFVINVDGSGQVQISEDGMSWPHDPAWSPDSNRIAFGSGGDIYIYSLASGSLEPVTDDGEGADDLAWSPDGSTLAFDRWMEDGSNLFLFNIEDRNLVSLTDLEADEYYPLWSPDGSQLIFMASGDDSLLYIIDADGGNLRELAPGMSVSWESYAWSPDGEWIAFISSKEVYIVRADGSGLRRVSGDEGSASLISWLP